MSNELKMLNDKVEKLLKLVAMGLVAEKPQGEQINFLSRIGFAPKEIASAVSIK